MVNNERAQEFRAVAPFDIKMNYVEITRDAPRADPLSHVHPECEIYVNITGDVSFAVEQKIYPILPGSIVITRPYEYHHCIYHTNAPHKHFWIRFSPQGNEGLFPRFYNRSVGEGNLLSLSPKEQKELVSLCHEMIECPRSPCEEYARFFRLASLMEGASVSPPSTEAYTEAVATALAYIDSHFTEPVSVRELARLSHVSVNTLERHFSQMLHLSPTAYLKKKRLSHAASLLQSGETVMDAALQSGFPDYCGFIALFKKHYGITPLQYRKRVRSV